MTKTEYMRLWRKRNPEKARANGRRYHWGHRKTENARSHEWRLTNHEYSLGYRRARYWADPIKARQTSIQWARDNKAKAMQRTMRWFNKRPDYRRLVSQRYRARRASAPGTFTISEWTNLIAFWANSCAYCGMSGRPLEADHRIPLWRGGPNDISNILPACKSCNSQKHTRTETEYRAARIAALRLAAA